MALESLYPRAFPDEDLVPLVGDLLDDPEIVLSLVAIVDKQLIGHVAFTECSITDSDINVALLAPLAVDPSWQKQGIGSSLVRSGLRHLENDGVDVVCVLGDPNYYGRFGFVTEALIAPPYPLAPEWEGAWQSTSLGGKVSNATGVLSVPPVWRHEALWSP